MPSYYRKRLHGFLFLVAGPVLAVLGLRGFQDGVSGTLYLFGHEFRYAHPIGSGSTPLLLLIFLGGVISVSGIWILIRWRRR